MHRSTFFMLTLLALAIAFPAYTQTETLQIVASHSILGDVVRNIAGDVASVNVTMPVGSDPHSFEASPGDLTTIADADVVFVNGAFFEEGLLESIENAGEGGNIIEVSRCVPIIAIGATAHHQHDEDHDDADDHDHETTETRDDDDLCTDHIAEFDSYHDTIEHDHSADEEHEDEHEHIEPMGRLYQLDCGEGHAGEEADHAHEEGTCDPHVWMDPHNVMYWTMLIRDTLIELDPAHADIYRTNASSYLDQLDSLTHDFVIPLIETLPEDNRILITSHDSLGYLAASYDFEIIGTVIPGGSTLSEPSVQDVAQLIDLIRDEGVPAIFGESSVNATITQTLSEETGTTLVVLYSGSLSDIDGPAATYIDYIRYNYTAIVEALAGA